MGEALIDVIVDPAGEVLAATIGGAPLNTARTLGRLGLPVSFLGGVSEDAFGRRIRRTLADDKVDFALASATPAPTTLAIAELDDHGAATYRFIFDDTSAALVSPEEALAAVPANCPVLHVGTLALVLEPLYQATQALVQAAPPSQIVMVDPNCRPMVMRDSYAFQQSWECVLERADIIKVSAEDVAFLFPDEEALLAVEGLHDRTGTTVLFTDGPHSVHVYAGGRSLTLSVPTVPVIDTVGAGDSFSGGFLAYWVSHELSRLDLGNIQQVGAAAELGIRVAGLTCQRSGADPPWATDLG